jgi:hypothetical protein
LSTEASGNEKGNDIFGARFGNRDDLRDTIEG